MEQPAQRRFMAMEFCVLGPLQAVRDGTPLPLGGPRQRAVLARLLLDPARVVPVDVLVDDVWDGAPPASARKTLQKYVSELRKSLGAGVVRTSGRGYSVDVDSGSIDAWRFEQLMASGDYGAALALWRGEALADLPDVVFVVAERARLVELRLVAVEGRLESDVASGRDAEAVPRLLELTEQHPLRERLCGLLMLALYRSGRQADALQAFQRHRRHLVDEIGVDPAEELRALERAILHHDPSLNPPTAPAGTGPVTGNLRLPISSFVGRHDEHRRVVDALRDFRLVTLAGTGGVGKTRLAMEVGARGMSAYPGGVWLLDLSGLADPRLLAHFVAVTLRVGHQPDQDDEETVIAALEHRDPILLVFDNCEHLISRCAALVDRIVRTSNNVRVLATSRRPLGVDGERVVPVAPLPDHDAVRLFADRAQLAGATRDEALAAEVAGICRSLDGLPLALELAASQLRVLGPREIAARLDDRLQFASSRFDAPPRQRSLRDMVAWSHDLLPPQTQRFFARLGTFATTMTLDAAAAVCGEDDPLEHVTVLVDHSLLVREPAALPSARFRMLDTVRMFALEKLTDSGESDDTHRAHAEFYLRLAVEAGPRLFGPDEKSWAARIEVEEPNLHVALAWAAERDQVLAIRLGVALWPYWDVRSRERYAIEYFTSVLAPGGPPIAGELRAWALTAMAELGANPGEARLATQWADEAARLFRAERNERGLAAALMAKGSAYGNRGSLDAADAALDEAMRIARRLGEDRLVARGLDGKSFVAARRGDHRLAEELSREELAAWSAIGSSRCEVIAMRHIAVSLQHLGHLDQAKHLCDRALVRWQELDDPAAIAHVQASLADISRLRGDLEGALRLYEESFAEFRRIGDRRCTASTYKNLAVIAAARGEHGRSAAMLLDAVRLRYELGDYAGLAECFEALAGDLATVGRFADAVTLLAAARQRRRASGAAASAEDAMAVERVEAMIRAALPAQRSRQQPTGARRLSVEDAVAFVLALDPEPA